MKSIPVDELEHRLSEALRQQEEKEPVLLTENSRALGLLVRLPEGLDHEAVDAVVLADGPDGAVLLVVQSKWQRAAGEMPAAPVYGSGRGMLTVVAEDDEHLNDFDEYMR